MKKSVIHEMYTCSPLLIARVTAAPTTTAEYTQ